MGAWLSSQSALADSFDWQSVNGLNWNTPVKTSLAGRAGIFPPCGTLEAKYMLTRNDPSFDPDVSEQQICWETSPDMGTTARGWGL